VRSVEWSFRVRGKDHSTDVTEVTGVRARGTRERDVREGRARGKGCQYVMTKRMLVV